MAYNLEPEKTASSWTVLSGSALFAYAILSEILKNKIFRKFIIFFFFLYEFVQNSNTPQLLYNTIGGVHNINHLS